MTDKSKPSRPGDDVPVEGTNFRRIGGVGTDLYRKLMRKAGVSDQTIDANLNKDAAGSADGQPSKQSER